MDIMKYGPDFEVLLPKELREKVTGLHRQAAPICTLTREDLAAHRTNDANGRHFSLRRFRN
jgi:hypothetical protein